ncbi:MAG TPA: diguanylate cyclase [Gemmatimonadales bacterium]|nr:diguanylate cyclase [Gemmatimonadales bacterium]
MSSRPSNCQGPPRPDRVRPLNFVIDAELCVACLACVRVCPTDAIAVAGDEPLLLQVVDEACIRCGQCLPACPHGAVKVNGEIGRALAIAAQADGALILSPESVTHFYPATPEQLINACYEAGFRAVTRGVIGDELVAAEYLKLWEEEPWGTLIRSTDPVVVETVRAQYPELLPYLAPVTLPAVAEARYLRAQHGPGLKIAYAGICPPVNSPDLDAAITYGDLDQLFRIRGVDVRSQPTFFQRVPEERRRHLSAAGGLPLALLEEARHSSRRFRKIRGLDALPAVARAVSVDRLDLGFVDILSTEGALDHPLSGPQEELYWRRELLAATEPPRSRQPVVDGAVVASIGATFAIKPRRLVPDPEAVAAILEQIGRGPNGRPWDCRACGFHTCQAFAEAAALGRASMRQCTPYQERRADDAQRAAAVDTMTGLSTYRVLRDRLVFEVERGKRSSEGFAVLFLDLDRFKEVNDQFGHEAGNDILRAVAGEIRNAVRASDVAARYGGDEFVVILTRTDLQGGARVAEALRAGIEGVGRRLGYPAGLITVSIGLAEFDPRQPSEGDLLVSADRALYRAKAAGRNAVA